MVPGGKKPAAELVSGLAKSYDLMNYDIAMLAQDEANYFGHLGVNVDQTRNAAKDAPFTKVKTSSGDSIGFIRFPSLRKGHDAPAEGIIREITSLVKKHQDEVKLLIGLSDWGWAAEREYLAQSPEYTPDFLFGSGYGSGVNGRVEADGRCVWVRPYDKGRTINEVRIFSWPDRSQPFVWEEPNAVMSLSVGLGDNYADNPDVSAILH
ncbi:hypothetical protein [Pseudodesulfovibrio sp. zrk46]|uniref:UshA-like (seleno)protein family 2 n=1 Tax=Pseudodesulfovibrio sp. zrk46 TaxID=2725288 RepID=UPI00144938BE|nr:hypothetical protein [Pseudodesulfovibrio sp. zrk46]QJB57663.1 hypothetical protein HFN16_15175 [Pseudodesulfovibrio sp. zrk46]